MGVDLLLPTSLPEQNSAEAVAAAVPQGHRDFIARLAERYQVPPATRGNFFSLYVRSQALFEEQVDAAVASGVQVFAAGVGTPHKVLARARAAGQHDDRAGRPPPTCGEGASPPAWTSWWRRATTPAATPATSAASRWCRRSSPSLAAGR